MTDARRHHTVGWRFRAYGGIYVCTRWRRNAGYDMRLEDFGEDPKRHLGRKIGDEANVSERAIGATYYRIHNDELYEAHGTGCNCYVCEGRPE